jgi:hypothetical protein
MEWLQKLKIMKIKCTIVFFILYLNSFCQSKDSLVVLKKEQKMSYKPFLVPAALIATGALLMDSPLNNQLQNNTRQVSGLDFETKIDNYIQYAPIAQLYAGRYLGFRPKIDLAHQTINLIIANAIMGTVVQSLKYTVNEPRPDGSNTQSFPSGHTALAFTNAALLFREYKDASVWYASSGFVFATATGLLRMANNKHYTADVLAGAGIGLASGFLVGYLSPFQWIKFGKKTQKTAFIYPQIGAQLGLGLFIKTD